MTECNNGVRKMKRIEELVSLETLLDFDKVKVGLFFFFSPFISNIFNTVGEKR